MANPNSFNDPFDSASAFSLSGLANRIKQEPISDRDSRLMRLIKGDSLGLPTDVIDLVKKDLKSFGRWASVSASQGLTSLLRNKLGVTCFTETPTSVPMWAHYAGNHAGFCCEWDLSDWPDATLRSSMFPVVYMREPLEEPPLVTNPHFPDAPKVLALIKSEEWGYEQEWRYVQWGTAIGDGTTLSVPLPKAVHLGLRIPPDSEEAIRRICETSKVEVRRMEADAEYLRLRVEE